MRTSGLHDASSLHEKLKNNESISKGEVIGVSNQITQYLEGNQHPAVGTIKDLLTVVCVGLLDENNSIVTPGGEKLSKTGVDFGEKGTYERQVFKRPPRKKKTLVESDVIRPARKKKVFIESSAIRGNGK